NGKIAFMSLRDGSFWDPEVYVMDPDGSNRMNLSNNPAGPRRRWLQGDYYPAWSPDGAKIAFSSQRFPDFENRHIYVMNADGSNQTRLTNAPGRWSDWPAWSPDGSTLAFDSNMDFSGYQIYVMNADGSNRIALTNLGNNASPDWSPDGEKIAFSSERSGHQAIY